MKLYPVIDIKNGNCVRTRQGQLFDTEIYSHFPIKVAKELEEQGANYFHVIDLEGAMVGHSVNNIIIQEIIEAVDVPVQVGGGIRTIKDIENKLNMGASRVVIGTKAAESPGFVKEAINIFGAEKVIVSIDVKNGNVLMEGWGKYSTYHPIVLAKKMEEVGITSIIVTDVMNEGMLQGPNIDFAKQIVEATNMDVIVSGGISSLKDLERIDEINVNGALLGKAIYEKRLDLRNAIELFGEGVYR